MEAAEHFPKARVLNFGTAGYGTTQSLLALQGYLDAPPRTEGGSKSSAPLIVVYGFSDFHADRNVASVPWIRGLAQLASRGHVATPYASLGHDGALGAPYPPTRYPAWWLHRQLATVALLEERWAQLQARDRTTQATAATEKLLIELDRVVRAHHGTLLVALLSQFQRNGIQPFRTSLQTHGIATAECLDPGAFAKAMQVPVYGHPNATINTHWASCIEPSAGADGTRSHGSAVSRRFAPAAFILASLGSVRYGFPSCWRCAVPTSRSGSS